MLLVSMGFTEGEVWGMTMDRFNLYTKAARRVLGAKRGGELVDTIVAIAGAFGGKDAAKKIDDYLREIDT